MWYTVPLVVLLQHRPHGVYPIEPKVMLFLDKMLRNTSLYINEDKDII